MRVIWFSLIFLQLIVINATAQEKIKDTVNRYDKYSQEYKRLKDSLPSSAFIPAVSSIIIKNKEWEFILLSSIFSANSYRNNDGQLIDLNSRFTYLYNSLQITYGLSKDERVNIGVDVNSALGRIDQDRNSSIFKVFNANVSGNSRFASRISSIGPRIRWRPLKRNYNLTIQNSFLFSLPASSEKQNILGRTQHYFLTQILYGIPVTERLFLFSQLGVQYGFKDQETPAILYSPINIYASYLIHSKTIPFVLFNYVPGFEKNDKWAYTRYFCQIGGGVQYQFSKTFLASGYYAANIKGKNYSVFNNYNLNIRLLY